jgi:hypothetical protein
MKSSDLRIGNFVGICYEDTFKAGQVIVLEPDVVHLSNRKYPDSDRDIIGVPLSEDWLIQFNFSYNPIIERWNFKDVTLRKLPGKTEGYWVLQSKAALLRIAFVHELQNLLHTLNLLN